jgi:hypothetical protein
MMAKKEFRGRNNNNGLSISAVFVGGVLMGFTMSSFLWLISIKWYTQFSSCSPLASALLASQGAAPFSPSALQPSPQWYSRLVQWHNDKYTTRNDDGWKQIHVFYGSRSQISSASQIPENYLGVNQWFSQYRQDEVVSRLLKGKRNGYYVDLASNDAIRISNTYALETFWDWNGLCLGEWLR